MSARRRRSDLRASLRALAGPGTLDERVRAFDLAADRHLDRVRGNPAVDRAFYTASELGDFSVIWQFFAVVRGLRRDGDLAGTARLLSAVGLESALVNGPIKSLFRRPRPTTVAAIPRPHRLRQPKTSSFPSGHASAATVFVVVASERDSWWPIYAAVGACVAISRAHVRIHHASDVVGGVVVGALLGGLFRWWWPADRALPRGLPMGSTAAASTGDER